METFLMLAARILLLNAFGWIWQCCNSEHPPERFRITTQAWGWTMVAVLLTYAAEIGALDDTTDTVM